MGIIESLSDQEVLTLTLIGEARGEPIQGIVAVGCVIRNRLSSFPVLYNNIKEVCLKHAQFSCWNEDDPNRPFLLDLGKIMLDGQELTDPYLAQCQWVAEGIMKWKILDNTRGNQHYITTDMFNNNRPKWAKKAINIKTIGNHTFFNLAK